MRLHFCLLACFLDCPFTYPTLSLQDTPPDNYPKSRSNAVVEMEIYHIKCDIKSQTRCLKARHRPSLVEPFVSRRTGGFQIKISVELGPLVCESKNRLRNIERIRRAVRCSWRLAHSLKKRIRKSN
ncbi:hypothetical protein F5B17DRAFT_245524 [Nemania serpens]|nr:hypothetical protein F5B17DRAFT_245524 [Nemania serpens]